MASLGSILSILQPILDIMNAFLAPLSVMLLRLFQPILRVLVSRVLPAWLDFMNGINTWIAGLSDFERMLILLGALAGGLAGASVGGLVGAIVGALVGAIVGGIAAEIANGMSLNGLKKSVGNVLNKIYNGVAGLAGEIMGGLSLNGLGMSLGGGLEDVVNGISNLAGDIWKKMKQLPGMIADKISSKLPSFASGGVVNSPTIAQVGERGSEAIIPLDRLEQMLDSGGGGGGGTQIAIGGGLTPFIDQIERDPSVSL
ncbi:MAG: hypothetical protein ACOCSF_06595 [Halanaeroarchaeum sp.]